MQGMDDSPKIKRANILRTRKYIAIICNDRWGGIHFSPKEASVFIERKDATSIWIGNNLKTALRSSRDLSYKFGKDTLPQDMSEEIIGLSRSAERTFWFRIRDVFGFKDHITAMSKSALVFASWQCDDTDLVCLKASRGRGAGHSAWYEGENQGRVFHVSINASDEELGSIALQALDACQPNYA
ncbi:hypothetical protein NKW84_16820 [Acetobacter senegalensis]|uniref:hypothetical protein n=1 Tax=Acetobacter senegalensis TaxID=446692 RepID=UPI0009EB2D0A|nr:hypothetical protein [Acetobacter senegalensis]MCP1197497.1 hypothetical protein [Acetobacter senegalensis]